MARPLLIAGLLLASVAARAEGPMIVTSDTPAYCLDLAQRMDAASPMPRPARLLWEMGRAMCQHGQVRAGLLRLRRAMMIERDATN